MDVYVMVIDYTYDDYKRASSSSEIIGVKKSFQSAWKTVLMKEAKLNKRFDAFGEDGEYETEIDISKLCKDDLEYYKTAEKEIKRQLKYKQLVKKLETTTIDDEFIKSWEEARCDFLGQPEFGMTASGYRAYVNKSQVEE